MSEMDVYDEIMAVVTMLQDIREKIPRFVSAVSIRPFEVKDAVSISTVAIKRLTILAETIWDVRPK